MEQLWFRYSKSPHWSSLTIVSGAIIIISIIIIIIIPSIYARTSLIVVRWHAKKQVNYAF